MTVAPLPCLLGTWMPVVFVTPVTKIALPCKVDAHQQELAISTPPSEDVGPTVQQDFAGACMETKAKPRPQMYSRRGFPIHPMPEESDEVWHGRSEKRQAAITLVQKSQEYKSCVNAGRKLPPLPNASDRSVSKRQWEGKLMRFRDAVKALAADLPSTATTKEETRPRWADMVDGDDEGEDTTRFLWADMVDDVC